MLVTRWNSPRKLSTRILSGNLAGFLCWKAVIFLTIDSITNDTRESIGGLNVENAEREDTTRCTDCSDWQPNRGSEKRIEEKSVQGRSSLS